MTAPYIIGIAGKAGHGKSTISNLIVDCAHTKVAILSFAAPVKKLLCDIFPYLTKDMFNDRKLKEQPTFNGMTPRQIMQKFASDFAREVDQKIWIYHAESSIKKLSTKHSINHEPPTYIVFDDVRFENEVALIRKYGGTIIHLERNEVPIKKASWLKSWFTPKKQVHASELGVRHLFDEANDFVLNTSKHIQETKFEVLQLAARRFNKQFEV